MAVITVAILLSRQLPDKFAAHSDTPVHSERGNRRLAIDSGNRACAISASPLSIALRNESHGQGISNRRANSHPGRLD